MGANRIMAQQTKVYLNDDGEPIGTLPSDKSTKTSKVYLDDTGEVIKDDAPEVFSSNRGTVPRADSFSEGFINSILGGEALDAGMEGAKGWMKGAIDIPGAIMSAVETGKNLVTDPIGTLKSIPEGMQQMWETAQQAGSNPEAFGRMMGEATGQPLTTGGIIKGTPSMVRAAGIPVEKTGSIMRRYQPVSGVMPRLVEGRTLRNIERGVGKGVERMGQGMQNIGRVENPANVPLPEQVLGQTDEIMTELPKPKPKRKVRQMPDGTFLDLDTGEMFDSSGKPLGVDKPKKRGGSEINRDSPFFKKNRD